MARFVYKQRLLVVGPLVLLLLFTGLLPPQRVLAQTSVALDPPSGLPATTVHATGTGFTPGHHMEVRWEDGQLVENGGFPVQFVINSSGVFDIYFLIPFTAIPGSRMVNFKDTTAGTSLAKSFEVITPDSVWHGTSSLGQNVDLVVKASSVTTIQFSGNSGVKICDIAAPIVNTQFSCTAAGGAAVITGQFISDAEASGTYSYAGQNGTWTATKTYSAPGPDTIAVTTFTDELNNDGNCSLREAVRAANLNVPVDACRAGSSSATDIIDLPPGTYTLSIAGPGEDAAATGDLDITDNLTIFGDPADTTIIDGNHLDRVFHIIGSITVDMLGITISNGQTEFSVDGGGIYNAGGTLSLQNSVLRDNLGQGYGGAIYNASNSHLTLSNSVVSNNNAFFGGGGINNLGNATITNTQFSDNKGTSGGGGIRNYGGNLSLLYSVLIRNSTVDNGGGIFNDNNGSVALNNSAIIDNVASSLGGGGISNQSGALNLNNVTISGNNSGESGGGISLGGTATLNNVTIFNNVAGTDKTSHYPSFGGGIVNSNNPLTVSNTIIAGNTISGGGVSDCYGTLTSQGYNLIQNTDGCTITGDTTGNKLGANPNIGPLHISSLHYYSGYTLIHSLLSGSPAIDAGNPASPDSGGSSCLGLDQRDITRPQDGNGDGTARCDMGAYEVQPTTSPDLPSKLVGIPAGAGPIWITGHDADHHCFDSSAGDQCHYFRAALKFISEHSTLPSTLQLLALDHGTQVATAVSKALIPDVPMVKTVNPRDPQQFSKSNLPLVDKQGKPLYSAIIIASDVSCGALPDGIACDNNEPNSTPDSDAINARAADIAEFFIAGGGILTLAGADHRDSYYNFLPVEVTPLPVTPGPGASGNPGVFKLDSVGWGAAVNINNSDINCCITHNSFGSFHDGPLTTIEVDAATGPEPGAPLANAVTLIGLPGQASAEQKEALEKEDSITEESNLGITTFLLFLDVVCIKFECTPALEAGLAVTSGANLVRENAFHKEAKDPIDLNFQVIAQPVMPNMPQAVAGSGFTAREAAVINAVDNNLAHQIALSAAFLTSINRAQGARLLKNHVWEGKQLQASEQYAAQLAGLLETEPQLLNDVESAFQAAGLSTQPFTAAEVSEAQYYIATHGLPASVVHVLRQLETSNTDISQIEQNLLALDPTAVAALGGGRFPQLLTDPSVIAALHQIAQVHNQLSGRSVYLPLIKR